MIRRSRGGGSCSCSCFATPAAAAASLKSWPCAALLMTQTLRPCSTSSSAQPASPASTHVRRVSADGSAPAQGADSLAPGMVDVSAKRVTQRSATATGELWLPDCVAAQMTSAASSSSSSLHEFCTKKGPVFVTATIAATQAAKLTPQLIPFCHPLPITSCAIDWAFDRRSADDKNSGSGSNGGLTVRVRATVGAEWVTGVEMEALTAASVALLTCYDMLKGIEGAVTGGMCIREVRLQAKSGGKLGQWMAKQQQEERAEPKR